MGEIFKGLVNFINSKSINMSRKVALVVVILLAAFLVNNYFSFSFYYNINNKLDALVKINSITSNKNSDSLAISIAKNQLRIISHHRNFYESFLSFFDRSSDTAIIIDTNKATTHVEPTKSESRLVILLKNFILNICLSGFFLWFLYYELENGLSKKSDLVRKIATTAISCIAPLLGIFLSRNVYIMAFYDASDTYLAHLGYAVVTQGIIISAFLILLFFVSAISKFNDYLNDEPK